MGAWNERPRVLCLVIVPRTVELSKTRPARILYFVYDARARARPCFRLEIVALAFRDTLLI